MPNCSLGVEKVHKLTFSQRHSYLIDGALITHPTNWIFFTGILLIILNETN
jgi:hypothetical protein